MTNAELKTARRELGMNKADIAKRLRTSYTGYVKWERGERPIPGLCAVAIELLLEKDRRQMAGIRNQGGIINV